MKHKYIKTTLATISALAIAGMFQAQAISVFTDEASFIAALSGPQSLLDFNSAPLASITGNEFSAQGFLFSSPVAGSLEVAPPDFFSSSRYLNVGERPMVCCDGDNDSLNVTIVGNWRAVGFSFVDGFVPSGSESIAFLDTLGNTIYSRSSSDGAVGFIGLLADTAIGSIVITEAPNDVDDIGYDNFRLGNAVPISSVPDSGSTLALLSIACAGMTWFQRRRTAAI
jgi:hypothetical protein